MKYFQIILFLAVFGLGACSSGPKVQKQKYATLKSSRTFEYDFETVWKAIEASLKNHKITERDPSEVSSTELKNLKERTLESDWIFTESRDKYITYKVNSLPRKKYLQMRYKYFITAQSQIGGTDVHAGIREEIQELNEDGSPKGYEEYKPNDTSRTSELLDKINQEILRAP